MHESEDLKTTVTRRARAFGPPVLPQLMREAVKRPDDSFRVLIRRSAGDTTADSVVAAVGGAKLNEVAGNAFVALVKGHDVPFLARQPAIGYMTLDAVMKPTSTVDPDQLATLYPKTVETDQVWNDGTTGMGVGIAVIDSGVNHERPDFTSGEDQYRVITGPNFNSQTTSNSDQYGHGTHLAGVIAGNSWWSTNTDVQGKYLGVAPESTIISVKVSNDEGMAYISDVINAIEWVIAHREDYNIRVMNVALISSVAESYTTSMLDAAVERAWFSGILVVVSAGNAGPDTMYYPPANDPFVVTVGATDQLGTVSVSDDTVAPWSSYGTTQDGYDKPEVVAPGRYMVATLASDACTLAKRFPDRVIDKGYLWLSGTSVSAAVISGIGALAFEAHPAWTNDRIKWLLMETAEPLGTTDSSGTFSPYAGQGSGEVSAYRVATYTGTPGYANQGIPISSHLEGPDGKTTYDGGSETTASWSSSTWSTTTWSTSISSSSTESTATWSSDADD